MKPRVLFVAGSTGATGQVLIRLADAQGLSVVPHVRPQSATKAPARAAVLDLADQAELVKALAECTTVVQLIGTMKKRFASGDTYETSDIGTTRQLVEAAKEAGVDHFLLLSSVGAGRPVGAYLRAKARAEALVKESGLPFTVFRPSALEGGERRPVPGLRALTRALGLSALQPITLEELSRAMLRAARDRSPLGAVLEGRALWELVRRAG
ncbi:MAG: SDR family oxidoreductase [Myxococcota bacterium]